MTMNKITKRIFALFMVWVMTLLLPANNLAGKVAFAADNGTPYIKELKLFVKTHGDIKDAQSWCDNQSENKDKDKNNDWCVIPSNLNEGASGALKKEVAVFMCYQKTLNVDEAVRDIAMMNEGGNYSVGEYEYMLNEQKDMYADLVSDMQDMLKEYRANYSNKVPSAVQAHDFLNTYIEDDSGKKLGDLLLDVSDADLATVLLQANGQVVIAVQEQLTLACDTNKATWLDRMSKIGSYDNLKKKFMVSYNINSKKAIKAMDQKYKDKATTILNSWDDIQKHFKSILDYGGKNGLNKMNEDEINAWIEEQLEKNPDDPELRAFITEGTFTKAMAAYEYGDMTIYNFFTLDSSEVSGDNLKQLYPVAASLTDGQFAALNETVSLYSILMAAVSATAVNDTGVGMSAKYDDLDKEDQKELEEDKEKLSEEVKEYTEVEPISVYTGVDRDIFKGGVAVTSTAKDYENAAGRSWTDSFVEGGGLLATSIGMAAAATLFTVGAVIASKYAIKLAEPLINDAFTEIVEQLNSEATMATAGYEKQMMELTAEHMGFTANESKLLAGGFSNLNECKEYITSFSEYTVAERNELLSAHSSLRDKLLDKSATMFREEATLSYRLIKGLKIGLAVFAVILAVADITMSIITLYKYYNRDHADIPKFMVDLTYDEDEGRSYTAYKTVLDSDCEQGDMNGGGGKQWLALYSTKDADAGGPILAPDGITSDFIVQYKNSKIPVGYSPLHMFGEPNVAQNLTFADGENGWSYNDKKGGIYLFFKRDAYDGSNGKSVETDTIASVIGQSSSWFLMIGCIVAGMLIGVITTNLYMRRRGKNVGKE
ncbi:MAG: hypothetical protein K6F77_05950 [Lachnospiraceae bacterium]|nr:hypothetical protein [Lachnospiraceae bacterium]